MDLNLAQLVGLFDRIGIVAAALAGVEVGFRKRFDVFGLLVMGIVTALGGGAVRDVFIGRTPLLLERPDYVLIAAGASAVGMALLWVQRPWSPRLLLTADAVGLGAFSVAGALAGIRAELPVTAVVMLAIITATGGGIIRDLLANRVPSVLTTEARATAAAIGGLVVWLLQPASNEGAALAGIATAAAVRLITLALGINLPAPDRRKGPEVET